MKRNDHTHIFGTDKLRSYGTAMKVVGNVDKLNRPGLPEGKTLGELPVMEHKQKKTSKPYSPVA